MRNKFQKGFTLIEMLIVVAIIAILAGIIFVGLPGFRNSALDSRRVADLKTAQSALELYYAKCRMYPNANSVAAPATCPALPPAAAGTLPWGDKNTAGTLANILTSAGIGINNLPQDPVAGQTYLYGYQGTPAGEAGAQSYVVGATLSTDRDVLHEANALSGTIFTIDCNNETAPRVVCFSNQ